MSRLHDAEQKLIDEGNAEAAETLETLEVRWKYAVFPAMIAFIVLAAFGFYLIYGMLQRMEDLSRNVSRMAEVIQVSMPSMQKNMIDMSGDIHQLNTTIQQNFPTLEKSVSTMSNDMRTMSYSTNSMALTTHNLSSNVWELNRNMSKPLSVMNNMLPWGNTRGTAPAPMPLYPHYPRQKNISTTPTKTQQ